MLEITSQRGTAGKMVYNYSFSGGVTLRGRRGVDMMNSKEKLELERRLENTATPGYRYSEDYYRKYHANDPNLESLIARGQQVLDSCLVLIRTGSKSCCVIISIRNII